MKKGTYRVFFERYSKRGKHKQGKGIVICSGKLKKVPEKVSKFLKNNGHKCKILIIEKIAGKVI